MVGNFKNRGARYCQQADQVKAYDFPSEAEYKATPYGIYDPAYNRAFVNVGISAVTPAFAIAFIQRWWQQLGATAYPNAHHLLIEVDAGGCNGHRPRLWK